MPLFEHAEPAVAVPREAMVTLVETSTDADALSASTVQCATRYRVAGESFAVDEIVAAEILRRTTHTRWLRETPRAAAPPTVQEIVDALRETHSVTLDVATVEESLARLVAAGRVEVAS
jgi:hypothetical protein